CYDNAVAESFFKTLKSELIYQEGKYNTRKEARMSIFEYIECYYNSKRTHSAIEYNTPREKLELYYKEMEQCA
ncbi:IS3 family transposase, partial [Flexistipes sp.]|uniref:IS3 family transposase n=1 Tax=Flexistipes sp. TaxID=3088135 RepID=UPI002E211AC8|nr:IS3 family transposase [Flexistipes sp.]